MARSLLLVGVLIMSFLVIPLKSMAYIITHPHQPYYGDLYQNYKEYVDLGYNFEMTEEDIKTIIKNNNERNLYVVRFVDASGKRALVFSAYSGQIVYEHREDGYLFVRTNTGDGLVRYLSAGRIQDTPGGFRQYVGVEKGTSSLWSVTKADLSKYEDKEPEPEPGEEEDTAGLFGSIAAAINNMRDWLSENVSVYRWLGEIENRFESWIDKWFIPEEGYFVNRNQEVMDVYIKKFPIFFTLFSGIGQLVDSERYLGKRPVIEYQGENIISYDVLEEKHNTPFGEFSLIELLHTVMKVSFSFSLIGIVVRFLAPKVKIG